MKRIISLVLALAVCAALVCNVSATNGGFVPSITYKPGPELVPIPTPGGRPIIGYVYNRDTGERISVITEECLVITPISMVDTSQKIPPNAAEELRWVYKQLLNGSMKIPYEKCGNFEGKRLVLRDLFDASWLCGNGDIDRGSYSQEYYRTAASGAVSLRAASRSNQAHPTADSSGVVYLGTASSSVMNDLLKVSPKAAALSETVIINHNHPVEVSPNGVVFDLTFDTGIAPDTEVVVMVYARGEWEPAVEVSNNGDGTVSCTFEKLGIISMSVLVDEDDPGFSEGTPPKTGDDSNVWLWAGVMLASLVVLVVLVVLYRREDSDRKRK